MASYEKVLPREQWHQVLMNLPPEDLCNVVLTSRHMNSVASWPNLWVGINVNRGKLKENGLAEFYSINRFRKITKMGFTGSLTDEEIKRILSDIPGSPLKELVLVIVNLSLMPGELLAKAVCHLQSVNLWRTHLTTDQSIRVLEACRLSNTLKHVNLMQVILNEVPAEILSSGISRLHTVSLEGTGLTNDQSLKVVQAILSSHTLVNVNLARVCLSQVPAELFAEAICRLERVHLYNTELKTSQCVQLLQAILSSTSLQHVDLTGNDLDVKVPADLLESLPEYVIYEDMSDYESSIHNSTDETSEMDESDEADTETNDDNDDDSIYNASDEAKENDGRKGANTDNNCDT